MIEKGRARPYCITLGRFCLSVEKNRRAFGPGASGPSASRTGSRFFFEPIYCIKLDDPEAKSDGSQTWCY
jgi:hypothetical protein